MLAAVVVPFLLFGDWFDTVAAQLLSGERKFEMFLVTSGLLAADVFIPVPSSAVSVSAGMLLGLPLAFLATPVRANTRMLYRLWIRLLL